PHTGHQGGDAKANWQGVLWHDGEQSRIVEVVGATGDPRGGGGVIGNGDGVCDSGEVCGIPLAEFEQLFPRYRAPVDGLKVTGVYLEASFADSGMYYGTGNQWRVDTDFCGYRITFGHVGW